MEKRKYTDRIGAIIVAAGNSTRMKKPKMLINIDNKPLFLYPVRLCLNNGVFPIILVTGNNSIEIEKQLMIHMKKNEIEKIFLVRNFNPSLGLSSSLKYGITNILDFDTDAVFIFLGDQPLITSRDVNCIIESYLKNKARYKIFRPLYNNVPGHPVLFDSSLYKEFFNLSGDKGAIKIIQNNLSRVHFIHMKNPIGHYDIDTKLDLDIVRTLGGYK
ncbi:nucleotidyltransferase family protein [Bacillus sp. JJ1562]|uniref:nucleotidyltransferase family protein n=1 Tax=Bacillus sp. JJ1562 TaxID=3122960 RepID=UPI0030020012